MTIQRYHGQNRGRCRAVSHNGLVYAVATDTAQSASLKEQTQKTLEAIDKNLADAGSNKSNLIQATVYLKDMSGKAEMDAVWCDWIGPEENWPQRACVGADLAGGDLVEVVVIAAIE